MTSAVATILCIAMTLSIQTPQDSQPASRGSVPRATGFLSKTLEMDGASYAYNVYVPAEYSPDSTWPVILFLHGSGERGDDGLLQTEIGIARAIRRNRKLCPAIVVMPQCRADWGWYGPMQQMALRCLEKTSSEYSLDPQRIYLTGLSLGGNGAWELGSKYARQFAAVVPICGFVSRTDQPPDSKQVERVTAALVDMPIWAFHGAADPTVSVEHTRAMVRSLRAAGATVEYTESPAGKHNVWDSAYANPRLWRWLLAQRREPEPPARP